VALAGDAHVLVAVQRDPHLPSHHVAIPSPFTLSYQV
jgi:hypothetical protein